MAKLRNLAISFRRALGVALSILLALGMPHESEADRDTELNMRVQQTSRIQQPTSGHGIVVDRRRDHGWCMTDGSCRKRTSKAS